jgi:hypothetical protein
MACKETYPRICSSDTRVTVCGSSYSASAIAGSVRVNTPCTFKYTMTLQRWDYNIGRWFDIASRTGYSNDGISQTFNVSRENFDYRLEVQPNASGASVCYSPVFRH